MRLPSRQAKLSHGFAQFVIHPAGCRTRYQVRARAWPLNSFIDNACQHALILRLVYQLLMPLVAGLRVICGSCCCRWNAICLNIWFFLWICILYFCFWMLLRAQHLWMSGDGSIVNIWSYMQAKHFYRRLGSPDNPNRWFGAQVAIALPIAIAEFSSHHWSALHWTQLSTFCAMLVAGIASHLSNC